MDEKLLLVLVGLPARGKSYVSNKLNKYLNWYGYQTKVFNLGDYRRRGDINISQDHTFFDHMNTSAVDIRETIAMQVLDDALDYIKSNNIAIYDGTNTTIERRNIINERCKGNKITPLFLELVCNEKVIITNNLNMKLISPDYLNTDKKTALEDFGNRLKHYEQIYKTINLDENLNFIKIVNNKIININNLSKNIEKEILNFLLYMKVNKNPIYLSRHGQSEFNILEKLGGNSNLSNKGKEYPPLLKKYVYENISKEVKVFTSTLDRTKETAKLLEKDYNVIEKKVLDEINAGICDGLTYNEVKEVYPNIHNERKKDKFNFRYPQGESYKDLVDRLNPFIHELESMEKPVLIISHNAITRVIYSYFMNLDQSKIPYVDVPLHTIIKLIPTDTCYIEERIKLM